MNADTNDPLFAPHPDGSPVTQAQAEALLQCIEAQGRYLNALVVLDPPERIAELATAYLELEAIGSRRWGREPSGKLPELPEVPQFQTTQQKDEEK